MILTEGQLSQVWRFRARGAGFPGRINKARLKRAHARAVALAAGDPDKAVAALFYALVRNDPYPLGYSPQVVGFALQLQAAKLGQVFICGAEVLVRWWPKVQQPKNRGGWSVDRLEREMRACLV